MIGVYGVISQSTAERIRELGLRIVNMPRISLRAG
jgi:hypothetical protein